MVVTVNILRSLLVDKTHNYTITSLTLILRGGRDRGMYHLVRIVISDFNTCNMHMPECHCEPGKVE